MDRKTPRSEYLPEYFIDHNEDVSVSLQSRQLFESYLKNQQTRPSIPKTIEWAQLKDLLEPRIDSGESWVSEVDPLFISEILRFIEEVKRSIIADSTAKLSQDRLYLDCCNTPIAGMEPEADREARFILAILYKYDLLLVPPSQPPLGWQRSESSSLDILI
jgi:hypothetical protein